MPSSSTFRRVLQRVDCVSFVALFNHWSQRVVQLTEETWVAADGKNIKSTLSAYSESYQNFVSTVSAFTHQQGIVLHLQVSENKHSSELAVVRQIITALAGQPIVFTLDALHCQKKTVESMVEQQQHDLIAVKANQPTLYQTLVALHQAGNPLTVAATVEASHNRTVHRRVSIYAAPLTLQPQWAGLQTLLWVERWGVREQKPFQEQVGYSSALALTATEVLPPMQQHWSIENRLHWVRAVTLEEDHARPGGHAPVMWAILHCFLLNVVR